MAEITICIPTYNKARILREALLSIRNQTVPVRNVIVIDDCSEDRTKEVVKEFKGVQYIRNQVNLGMPENWNEAFRQCKTKYLCILHDDDLIDRVWHEAWGALVEQNADCGIFFSRVALVTNAHVALSEGCLYRSKRYSVRGIYSDLMKARMFGIPVSGATIYNVELLSSMQKFIRLYNEGVNIFPDLEFHERVIQRYPVYYDDRCLAYSRREYVSNKSKELGVNTTLGYYKSYIKTVIPHYCKMYADRPEYISKIWLHFLFVSIVMTIMYRDLAFIKTVAQLKKDHRIDVSFSKLPAIWFRDLYKYTKYTIKRYVGRYQKPDLE